MRVFHSEVCLTGKQHGLLHIVHTVATVRGGEIIIPLPNCGQVRLISKVGVPPNLESLLNSLGYSSQLTGAWLGFYPEITDTFKKRHSMPLRSVHEQTKKIQCRI